MSAARTIFSLLLVGGFATSVSVLATARAYVAHEEASLPDISTLTAVDYAPPSVILASDGRVLDRFASGYHSFTPYADIPLVVRQAFVAAEDRNFWKHDGMDPQAIGRAAYEDFRHRNRRAAGASTITQQVIKNRLGDDRRTLERKVREVLLARRAERMFSKEAILQTYLDTIWLGHGAYGVGAASDVWFGKPLARLTLAEAAFLASLPKGPSNYDPAVHPQAALARRHYVLRRMQDDGYITAQQAAEADESPLPEARDVSMTGEGHGYYQETVRRRVGDIYGPSRLYDGGVVVRSSMNRDATGVARHALVKALVNYSLTYEPWLGRQFSPADAASRDIALQTGWRACQVTQTDSSSETAGLACRGEDGLTVPLGNPYHGGGPSAGDWVWVEDVAGGAELRQVPGITGSVVVMDARQGDVLAEEGGFSYAASRFDRATQALRQPGSTIKPFVYLAAFEHGYTPASPVLDVPVDIGPATVGSEDGPDREESVDAGQDWRPGGDGNNGIGLTTMGRALALSRNMAAVRTAYEIGLPAVGDVARRFGLYDDMTDYSAVLGAHEITLMKLTAAYARIANGGHAIEPRYWSSLQMDGHDADGPDADGPVPPGHDADAHDVTAAGQVSLTTPEADDFIRQALRSVVVSGTARRAFAGLKLPVSGKTGTSNAQKDATFVGFCGNTVIGVRIGYDVPQTLRGMAGTLAAPVAADIFRGLPPSLSCIGQ